MLVPELIKSGAMWCWLAGLLRLPMEKAEFNLLLLSLKAWIQVTFFYKAASFHKSCKTLFICGILYSFKMHLEMIRGCK